MGSIAEPILASSIWAAYQAEHQHFTDDGQARPTRPHLLLTGCRNVDQGLPDVFTYGDGGLICISAESGAGDQEVGDILSFITPGMQ